MCVYERFFQNKHPASRPAGRKGGLDNSSSVFRHRHRRPTGLDRRFRVHENTSPIVERGVVQLLYRRLAPTLRAHDGGVTNSPASFDMSRNVTRGGRAATVTSSTRRTALGGGSDNSINVFRQCSNRPMGLDSGSLVRENIALLVERGSHTELIGLVPGERAYDRVVYRKTPDWSMGILEKSV